MQIFILGMHRSGTSAVTNLVTIMGADFGDARLSIGANEQNAKGFFERRDVIDLDTEILAAAGASWDLPLGFDPSRLTEEQRRNFVNRASSVLAGFAPDRPAVLKDPRMCLTLAIWREAAPRAVAVIVLRNPLEIGLSLCSRNDLALGYALSLWEHYTLESLRWSDGMPRLLLSYNRFMDDPVGETADLLEGLAACEVAGLRMPSREELRELADPSLYRNRSSNASLEEALNVRQLELYQMLERTSASELPALPKLSKGARYSLEQYAAEYISESGARTVEASADKRHASPRYLKLERKYHEHLERHRVVLGKLETAEQAYRKAREELDVTRQQYARLREKLTEAENAYQRAKEKRVAAENAFSAAKERITALQAENEQLREKLRPQSAGPQEERS